MKYIRQFLESEINPNTFNMLELMSEDFNDNNEIDGVRSIVHNGNLLDNYENGQYVGAKNKNRYATIVFGEASPSKTNAINFESKMEYTQDLYEYILYLIERLKSDEGIIFVSSRYVPNGINDWIRQGINEILKPDNIYTVGTKAAIVGGIDKPVLKVDYLRTIELVFKSKDI